MYIATEKTKDMRVLLPFFGVRQIDRELDRVWRFLSTIARCLIYTETQQIIKLKLTLIEKIIVSALFYESVCQF